MKLTTIGVVGAGTSGRSIIRALAGSGLSVIFCEVSQEKVQEAVQGISDDLDREIARWGVTQSEKKLILTRIRGTQHIQDLVGVQMVIEAIPRGMKERQNLFRQMDAVFPSSTILVTNSPTAPISDLAEGLRHPQRVVGMHVLLSRICTENEVSLRMTERFGFSEVGVMHEVGEKFGRMLDVAILERLL
jgi:3-hydroxybutyryl-CoA dehydrogenase